LVYIFILVDVKHEERDKEIKRITEKKDEEIQKKDEEIKRITEEKDEEIQKKDEEIKKIIEEKDKEIKGVIEEKNEIKRKYEIYRINKTAWHDFVGEGFEIENGVLGLERDVYLSIVKFLDSHILRKV
jgi:adenine-specific DNA methylase